MNKDTINFALLNKTTDMISALEVFVKQVEATIKVAEKGETYTAIVLLHILHKDLKAILDGKSFSADSLKSLGDSIKFISNASDAFEKE